MIRKISFVTAFVSMISLVSFVALAMASGSSPKLQDVQIQRGAGARCPLATEIKNIRAERFSGSQTGIRPGVKVFWTVTRMASTCPIKSFNVSVDVVTARGDKLFLSKSVRPGECCPSTGNNVANLNRLLNTVSSTILEAPAGKTHFIASDSKITARVSPVF